MRANPVSPFAFTATSSLFIVSFGPMLLGMVINPSAAIAYAPHSQIATIPTIIATNLLGNAIQRALTLGLRTVCHFTPWPLTVRQRAVRHADLPGPDQQPALSSSRRRDGALL